tara:strand:+ start:1599 stop:2219 length:621 start_codon:yes stop_codon:yes gene_type:complete
MALSKKKLSRKKIIQLTQISLLLAGLLIIFFTYFGTLKKDQTSVGIESVKKIDKKDSQQEDNLNSFEDVEYKGVDTNGNRFVIASEYANFTTDRPEIINMSEIECVFYFKDGTNLVIVSDYGIFNNVTNDMEFTENVKMNYLENVLFSEKANFTNSKNELLVEGDVVSHGPEGKLQADRLDFDLNTKKLKISMYNDKKVNIKVNLQ